MADFSATSLERSVNGTICEWAETPRRAERTARLVGCELEVEPDVRDEKEDDCAGLRLVQSGHAEKAVCDDLEGCEWSGAKRRGVKARRGGRK